MEKNKVKTIKEYQLKKQAEDNFDTANKYHTNPIKAKFKAFQKTKSQIDIKDLL